MNSSKDHKKHAFSICVCDGEAHIGRNTKSRVGKRFGEGGQHGGFIRIISIQIGDFNLQCDVLLVAQRDQRQTILPLDRQKM